MSIENKRVVDNPSGNELNAILGRLKQLENVKSDKDLAGALRVAPGTISAWRKRNSVPYEKVAGYGREKGISLEWLVNGKGPIYLKHMIRDDGLIYEVKTNQDAIYDIAADVLNYMHGNNIHLSRTKIYTLIKLLHRDALQMEVARIPESRIKEVIELAL